MNFTPKNCHNSAEIKILDGFFEKQLPSDEFDGIIIK